MENEWKTNELGRRKSVRTISDMETVRHMSLTQNDRSERKVPNQTTQRLHWLTPSRVDGGLGRGRNKGKWAVSTDGSWTQNLNREDMEQPPGSSYRNEDSAEILWRNWGHLAGGGNPSPSNGDGSHGGKLPQGRGQADTSDSNLHQPTARGEH